MSAWVPQVATIYHDATIGNAINIVLVRIIYLEHDEVFAAVCALRN